MTYQVELALWIRTSLYYYTTIMCVGRMEMEMQPTASLHAQKKRRIPGKIGNQHGGSISIAGTILAEFYIKPKHRVLNKASY